MATVRKRPSGKWEAQILVGGKRRAKRFDTPYLARRWATAQEAARDRGEVTTAPAKLPTLAEYWAPLERMREATLAPNTTSRNETHWRLYLEPAFGEHRLDEIRRADVKAFVLELLERKVGTPTVKATLEILTLIYNEAIDAELVSVNPAVRMKLPDHAPKRKGWLDPSDLERVVEKLAEPYAFLVELTAGTGLRWSEVAGLRVAAIGLDARTLVVESTLSRKGVTDRTKSEASRRFVPVPEWLRDELLERTAGKQPGDLVFTGPHGGTLSDRNVNERHLTPACERAGVPRFTFHALRHHYISVLVAEGRPLWEIAKIVGQADTKLIEKRYAHLAPTAHEDALAALGAARRRA